MKHFLVWMITIPVFKFGFSQDDNTNYSKNDFKSRIEFQIETCISQLFLKGSTSLELVSETSSTLTHVEYEKYSTKRHFKPGYFVVLGVTVQLKPKLYLGLLYRNEKRLILEEEGSINSVNFFSGNTIVSHSIGSYIMRSELENASLMTSLSSQFFLTKIQNNNLMFNYGISLGYSNTKSYTQVPEVNMNLEMYSDSFQPNVNITGSVDEIKMTNTVFSWSLFSSLLIEPINFPKITLGYRLSRLGDFSLIKKDSTSSNLIQSNISNDEQNSNTTETLSLKSTNNNITFYTHNISISLIF